jgi:hypothetical protein
MPSETRFPDRLDDSRRRFATDSCDMRHAHAPIIAVEHVVHIEKKGRDHKIGARGLRAKRGVPGRCGTTLTVVLDIMSCFLPKEVASERATGTRRYLRPRQVDRGNSPKNTWCASRSLAIDLSWMITRRLRLIRLGLAQFYTSVCSAGPETNARTFPSISKTRAPSKPRIDVCSDAAFPREAALLRPRLAGFDQLC